jgi:acetyl/propionyl-CoA carboxylase alpha subunit
MRTIAVQIDGQSYTVEVRPDPTTRNTFTAVVDGEPISVILSDADGGALPDWVVAGRRPYEVIFDPELRWLQSGGRRYHLEIRDLEAATSRPASGDGRVKAPIPGLVTRLLVAPGQTVEPGQPLLILEAMKMENEIRAPRGGVVQQVHAQTGQGVARDALLVEIE